MQLHSPHPGTAPLRLINVRRRGTRTLRPKAAEEALTQPITMRTATPADEPLLRELFLCTRRQEVAAWGWDTSLQQVFLEQQWKARRVHDAALGALLRQRIVQYGAQAIGQITLVIRQSHGELNDIVLLPAFRGRGIGTALIRAEMQAASEAERRLTLHLPRRSPALRLYVRLGFRPIADDGLYVEMAIES